MCPDPFDYSGPVPNGSPPQNDFRARSAGILPLGAAPRPWPQVVRAGASAAGDAADATVLGEPATPPTVSVLQTAVTATGGDEPITTAVEDAVVTETPEVALTPVPTDEPIDGHMPADAAVVPETGASPPDPSPQAAVPPQSETPDETPGWRPRR
jgi:hypothetical protein